MSTETVSFETWKLRFREDCEIKGKLPAYSNLGEDCLGVLWETGTEPSVQGVIDGAGKAA
jgi:hypothetical protein